MKRRKAEIRLFTYVQIVICLFILSSLLYPQEGNVLIETRVDTTIATIGDRIHYTVKLTYPRGTSFQLPELEGKLDKFELIDQKLTPPQKKGDLLKQEWHLVLTVFDTGKIEIPALELIARKESDTTVVYRFETEPKIITVYSVLPPDSREIKDIKPPFKLPAAIPWRWLIFMIILVAAGGGSYWYYLYWKKTHPNIELNEIFLDPPHVVALRRLQDLANRTNDDLDVLHQLFFELSEIIRAYLERRYFIRALEMATSEIEMVLPEIEPDNQVAKDFANLLHQIDFIKYAGISPNRESFFNYLNEAKRLVEKSKKESFLRRVM